MNNRFFLTLTSLLLALLNLNYARSAEPGTNATASTPASVAEKTQVPPAIADVEELIARIKAKIQPKQNSEATFADNLKEFDALLAKHKNKGENPEDVAHILRMKGQLYLEVLNEPEKALAAFKQIKSDFPTVEINGSTDDFIAAVQDMVDKKKIRDTLAPGTPFPDFNETDVTGNPLSISKYKGKIVLVDFWATWCEPCIVITLPEIQKAYEKYHEQGFEVVGISLDEKKEKLEAFTKEHKMPWPEFFDGKRWENKLATKYGVAQTPSGYLLDRGGKIILSLSGEEDLSSEVAKALKK
jgi:peroxiredoxin